ncbi:leucine-rich repeat and guanylate kinase domain-containing protein isoform X5 [Girardinichthys multiradiatus]|uniref:leucine-rich repeat and guanylate kinase domain-containing protein isoform X5 n=1 Tax=Girardinichthys multiradiatus TaxID=208333 RepID=UPI001FAE6D6D|nr:leucine-rich repeat and guanylate kinase domain-containing protein isoform X5 [Girardinichthys multiradiatus]
MTWDKLSCLLERQNIKLFIVNCPLRFSRHLLVKSMVYMYNDIMEDKLHEQLSVTPSEVCLTESLNAAEKLDCGELKENNKDGVLTEEMVSGGLSHLGCDLTGQQHVLCDVSLPGLNLRDISVLYNYVHLRKLELHHNNIKDLSCLSCMPHLIILDVSHNEISNFFEFQPLQYLQVANFSYNHIPDIKDLAGFFCLRKLDLDCNCLSEISGLEQCSMLTHLSLAYNKITKITLSSLPLTHLCLRGNQLKDTEGLENLQSLQVLDLSMNRITCLSGLQNLRFLCSINLEKNQILKIPDLRQVIGLPLLTNINLLENPVQEQPNYRLEVIFLHRHLTMLDQETVSVKEKVSSRNMFDPPMEVLAAIDHITHVVYQMGQPQILYHSTPPTAGYLYQMLVLTGPEGCGKEELAHRLCQEFGEYFGVGICHTTRKPFIGEENGIDYHFVSEADFQNLVHMGKFIQAMQYGAHLFGLTSYAIEDVAEEGLICCVHMELEGVFSLKKSCFKPRYILLVPTQVDKFISQLKSLNKYTPPQIDHAVQRVDLYLHTNEQRPGFFDNVIPCDDCEEAYQTLQQVVKDYLLVVEEEEGKSNCGLSSDRSVSGFYSAENPHPLLSRSRSETRASLSGSALDPSNSSFMPCFTNIQAKLNPSKISIQELASMRRREQLAREAVVGKRPGLFSQLFKRYKFTQKASSLQPYQDPGTCFQEDSSSDMSHAGSLLSLSSSASGTFKSLHSSMLEQTSELLKDRNLEFEAKSILPPIPTGNKTGEALKSPQLPRIDPKPPVKKNKGANVEG